MSIEHLNSIFLGGNRDEAYKREILNDYIEFLNKWIKSDLVDSQKKIFYSLKLGAAVPKNDEESRIIMMVGIHSKIVFSSFAVSKGEFKVSVWN